MNSKFKISVCSDLDYEEMVADICYEDLTVAMITQENGIDKMEIEILHLFGEERSKFLLDDFITALASGKEALIRMQKLPE